MATDREHCPHGISDDVVVAVAGRSARSQLQSADVIMGDTDGLPAATLAAYPGCAVAGLRDVQGRWCLLALRDAGTVLVRACQEPLDHDAATLLAVTCHACRSAGRPADVLRCLREASPVPIRVAFVPDAAEEAGS